MLTFFVITFLEWIAYIRCRTATKGTMIYCFANSSETANILGAWIDALIINTGLISRAGRTKNTFRMTAISISWFSKESRKALADCIASYGTA